jgi:hypothetical protein
LAACALFALTCTPATAQTSRKKSIWGPVEVAGRSQFPIYADLGVGIFQMSLRWANVAPTRPDNPSDPSDPAYVWPPQVDLAVSEARRYGMQVSIQVASTPPWANGGRDSRWAPTRPHDYAVFMEAAAHRYPTVHHWMIWGEPTNAQNFQPLSLGRLRPLRGNGLRGPHLYARMLDASYAALKRVNRRNLVIGGNTYTVGYVAPRRWIEALRLPNGRPPRMDLYGHNPFSFRRPDLSHPMRSHVFADFGSLPKLAGWIDENLKGSRPDGSKLKLFLSEYTLPTAHANDEFNFFTSRAVQARWLTDALRIARGWSRIYTLGYFALYDPPPQPDGMQVERGLLDYQGRPKPAYEAFKLG